MEIFFINKCAVRNIIDKPILNTYNACNLVLLIEYTGYLKIIEHV